MIAAIPSPGFRSIEIGPLNFRLYGVMIALGVFAAVWLAGKRFAERGRSPDLANGIALWGVPAGLVGARLYHVITDWSRFEDNPADVVKVWEGGLGILGGIVLGTAGGLWYARRRGVSLGETLDVCAPALPLAQAIGRWGNWFNQELFGRPTDLPWALKIDPEHRPARFADEHTFHPTFLYESLWNVALVALVLWIDRKRVLARGYLLAVYVAGYSIGRLWIEAIRVDPASEVGGLRVNLWVYGIVLILAVAALVVGWRRGAASVPTAEAGDGADAGEAETDDRSPLAAE